MCSSNKRLCNKSKKTAGKAKHELPDAFDNCMVGLCHKKLLLGTKSPPKEPWGGYILRLGACALRITLDREKASGN